MANVQCDLSEHPLFGKCHDHGDAVAVVTTEGENGPEEIAVCEGRLNYLVSALDLGARMTIVRHEPRPLPTGMDEEAGADPPCRCPDRSPSTPDVQTENRRYPNG